MAIARFNATGAGGLPTLNFSGTAQSTPNDSRLITCVVASTVAARTGRFLEQPLIRGSGSLSLAFGVASVPITFDVTVTTLSVTLLEQWLNDVTAYSVGGRFTLLTELGQSFANCEWRAVEPEGAPRKLVGVNQWLWRGRIEFRWMQPK